MQEAPALPSEIKSIVGQHAPLQCFIATQVNTITSLQSRVDFLQVEHDKLAKLLAAQIAGRRKEHTSRASFRAGFLSSPKKSLTRPEPLQKPKRKRSWMLAI